MEIQASISQIQDLIAEARKIAVFTHKNLSLDSLAALLSLGQIFQKLKKDFVLISPEAVPAELQFLKGVEKINHQLGPRNLIIEIKGGKDMVEKVSYFTQGDNFNLVITPQKDNLTPEQIQYSFTSLEADLLIVLDTIRLTGLGEIVETYAQEFQSLPLINIDRHTQNTRYGKINLIDNSCSSTSEIILSLADKFQIEWDHNLATTFLAGIYGGSRNFLSKTTSLKSFLGVARLLEKGADLNSVLENVGKVGKIGKQEDIAGAEKMAEGEKIREEILPEIEDQTADQEGIAREAVVENLLQEPATKSEESRLEEYHLPTPILKPHGEPQAKDNSFSGPKIFRSL
ncbi:hypothetical protein COS81_00235 [candidate division WWE3 bacterium CG06_land_8_20_14_3_00_42_16]|uniref:DDH domain-containing protein n=4 Tax=Katanobacteria TaxID=422282 RepID=A0A2M7APP0_UNCKA|nr:MAG: hypothetical protein COS81_00235 [candidate division WWE3 bacterium CG06_land_8_20_14_3_00_42_16]PIZ43232.1 MAG: hypothetical protein COY34_01310 [candidate division WWE3 bacterium CG_4_10_14_0_2_um_filter_42_8]PJA37844.1 MAG: hypothetical protein CO181_01955 [candidate division WWE3 bacterium CG_4_9_14_3_um_filter_43_9]PJC69308.1 MAG: hypothetical protein CO015_00820 [candidate division WWE3 bacterium CG_4_8_14_3_um_filter_42_11]